MAKTMVDLFLAAHNASVPLLVVRTADQSAAIEEIRKVLNPKFPLVQWDAARGVTPVGGLGATGNTPGAIALGKNKIKPDETLDFVAAMAACQNLPENSIVCARNVHRQLHASEPGAVAMAIQAVANLRDSFKRNFRMLVLLAPQFTAPMELEHDVIVIDHALPSETELAAIVKELHETAEQPQPDEDKTQRAVDALVGLSTFEAEQVTAMSLTRSDGLDLEALWDRKRTAIEQTVGLTIYRGKETFDDIVGLGNVKTQLALNLKAKQRPGVVVVIDEIDKVLANVEQDTSGVRMDQLRSLLTNMEDNEWNGIVLSGPPGAGKTLVGKAFGNMAGVPTIFLDLGRMESKWVGDSEERIRAALDRIKAIGNNRAYFIATSNNSTIMRPELQRRFTDGFYWVDLMSPEDRAKTWAFYMKKYNLKKQPTPTDDGNWTGAEIRNCARRAWNCGVSLVEAAQFIIPVASARADDLKSMRLYAHGRYLDANKPGKFDASEQVNSEVAELAMRAIRLPDKPESIN